MGFTLIYITLMIIIAISLTLYFVFFYKKPSKDTLNPKILSSEEPNETESFSIY